MSARCAVPAGLTGLTGLTGQQRRALAECFLRGASESEAAARLNVSPGTVRALLHQALHTLREGQLENASRM